MQREITITKEFDFDAAHWLPRVHHNHKCRRIHGHTYRAVLECSGEIGADSGWLVDYADIARAWAHIHDRLDHRCLNGIAADPARGLDAQETVLENPTTENLVHWIFDQLAPLLPSLRGVRVYESATTYAEARR